MNVTLTIVMLALLAPGSECPDLFGTEEMHENNEAMRSEVLVSIADEEHMVTIVHTGDWIEPVRVEYEALELVGIEHDDEDTPSAVFRLSAGLEDVACEPGLYAVVVGDNLGEDGHVLAIMDDLVLVEQEGWLGYVLLEGAAEPHWRMVWKSPWIMQRLPESRRSSRTRRHNRRRRKRRR
jgi:hypothetical protein